MLGFGIADPTIFNENPKFVGKDELKYTEEEDSDELQRNVGANNPRQDMIQVEKFRMISLPKVQFLSY